VQDAQKTDDYAVKGRVTAAIAAVRPENASPSMAEAQAHPIDPSHYTKQETALATHAMDRLGQASSALSFVMATGFPGFPTLALLSQLPEYRSMHERFADECVKAWGKVISTGAATDGKLAAIEAELKRVDLRSVVRTLIAQEQAFGRSHGCINVKDDDAYLTTPLVLRPFTVKKGSFEGVSAVEAYWVSPNNYNSIDPSKPDFYKPSSWWMLGKEIHSTRLWTLVSRPVSDMLKPAYSFAGVSMTQLAMPYVDNWLRTRQSVSDTVKQFSVSGVLTDLSQWLTPGGARDLVQRAELINAYRDNRNLLFLDKSTEEFFQINTPLAGLSDLQAQAQEQQSSVSHIPLVILLGITPNGLNASSDGEFRAFYDRVLGYLNNVISPLILYILQVVQMSLYAEIDDTIGWEWFPLMTETLAERSERHAKDADTDVKYIEAGVVDQAKVAARLEADPHSMYAGVLTESLDDIDDTDIEGITEHILNMEPAAPTQSEQHGQAGSTENTEPGTLDSQASAISTPHSDPGRANDPTAKRNNRKKMGV
jgi:phage-related protein (TIGR01555 family)